VCQVTYKIFSEMELSDGSTLKLFFNTYLIAKLDDALELVPMWKSLVF
jgi:hypothetical protein